MVQVFNSELFDILNYVFGRFLVSKLDYCVNSQTVNQKLLEEDQLSCFIYSQHQNKSIQLQKKTTSMG